MLLDMLRTNEAFNRLPTEQKHVLAKLADPFESYPEGIYCTPVELAAKLQIGSHQHWFDFLNMDIVRQYIKAQIAFNLEVGQRRALPTVIKNAGQGDIQAAKMVNDMSGILNSGERNKVVVLHRIVRPTQQTQTQPVS